MTEPDDELIVLPALMSYRDTAHHAFRPPALASIEAAGIRRRREHYAIGGVAAIAVIAMSAAVLLNLPRWQGDPPVIAGSPSTTATAPSVTLSPSTSPAPVETASPTRSPEVVPLSAMLQPEDAGAGYGAEDDGEFGDWHLESLTNLCQSYNHKAYPGPQPMRSGGRERRIANGSSYVFQAVWLSDVEYSTWRMAEIRAFARDCATFAFEGRQYRLEIVAENFAGDDSIMVREGEVRWVYVRRGDVLTEMRFTGFTQQQMKEMAIKAAARLCDTTKAC